MLLVTREKVPGTFSRPRRDPGGRPGGVDAGAPGQRQDGPGPAVSLQPGTVPYDYLSRAADGRRDEMAARADPDLTPWRPLRESPPEPIAQRLRERGVVWDDLLLCTHTDIDLLGNYQA